LSVFLCIYLCVCLPVCLSACVSVCLSTRQPVHLYINAYFCPPMKDRDFFGDALELRSSQVVFRDARLQFCYGRHTTTASRTEDEGHFQSRTTKNRSFRRRQNSCTASQQATFARKAVRPPPMMRAFILVTF